MALATRLADHLTPTERLPRRAAASQGCALASTTARSSSSSGPSRSRSAPRDVVVKIGGAGVCATDLHAHDGLMEPAGLTPPVVLGHENAGWVHAVGDDVTTAAVGDAVLVYPAVQLRPLRRRAAAASTCTASATSSPG